MSKRRPTVIDAPAMRAIVAKVCETRGSDVLAVLSISRQQSTTATRRAAYHELESAGYTVEQIAQLFRRKYTAVLDQLARSVEVTVAKCKQCGEVYQLQGHRLHGRFCSIECREDWQDDHPSGSAEWYLTHVQRHEDRLDCVHYSPGTRNLGKRPSGKRGVVPEGCLWDAARENRPSVCLKNCPRYEPLPVEISNPLQSSMGLFVDEIRNAV